MSHDQNAKMPSSDELDSDVYRYIFLILSIMKLSWIWIYCKMIVTHQLRIYKDESDRWFFFKDKVLNDHSLLLPLRYISDVA